MKLEVILLFFFFHWASFHTLPISATLTPLCMSDTMCVYCSHSTSLYVCYSQQVAVERHLRLQRDRMNIHQFNVSQTHKNMYLSLLVTLDPIATDARAFPITAVIRWVIQSCQSVPQPPAS